MNKLIAVSTLMLVSVPAFAAAQAVPEPGMLPLMGAAAIAFFISRRFKK
ncbi:PEP-CTERM sorting domain-containing protein [Neptunomonas sp.]